MSPADRDLKLMAAVACLAVLTAFTVDTPVVRTLPALLMLLVVPGYALSVALLPAPRDVFERCLIALGLSLCVDVLGGLLIDRTGSPNPSLSSACTMRAALAVLFSTLKGTVKPW